MNLSVHLHQQITTTKNTQNDKSRQSIPTNDNKS